MSGLRALYVQLDGLVGRRRYILGLRQRGSVHDIRTEHISHSLALARRLGGHARNER